MSDLKLGEIITTPQHRDAVHVAIAPVKAGEMLHSGQRVCFASEAYNIAVALFGERKAIGIVDPFLQQSVREGQTFWLFLFPGTITALRHEWTHPAFNDEANLDKSYSERWLRGYAAKMNCYDNGEEAYQRLIEGLREGEIFSHGSDLHSFADLDEADELKLHAERVLGIQISWDHFRFVCSC